MVLVATDAAMVAILNNLVFEHVFCACHRYFTSTMSMPPQSERSFAEAMMNVAEV
jgi:hypothetical protein